MVSGEERRRDRHFDVSSQTVGDDKRPGQEMDP
jgi:hypothetical protein